MQPFEVHSCENVKSTAEKPAALGRVRERASQRPPQRDAGGWEQGRALFWASLLLRGPADFWVKVPFWRLWSHRSVKDRCKDGLGLIPGGFPLLPDLFLKGQVINIIGFGSRPQFSFVGQGSLDNMQTNRAVFQ